MERIDLKIIRNYKANNMKRGKHVIIEDINSIEDVEHVVLENDVFIDDEEKLPECCCFNKPIIRYWLDVLSKYFD